MTAVYDTSVLIAADRNDRNVWADHRARLEAGLVPVTTAPVVAQASRLPRQAQMRRFLRDCDAVPFASDKAHRVGALLAVASVTDVVDAHVAVTAARLGGTVITSEPNDFRVLAMHARPRFRIVKII